jgi:hypothetical protein
LLKLNNNNDEEEGEERMRGKVEHRRKEGKQRREEKRTLWIGLVHCNVSSCQGISKEKMRANIK